MKAVTLEDQFIYTYVIVIILLMLKGLKRSPIHYMQNCFEKKLAESGISKFKNLKN